MRLIATLDEKELAQEFCYFLTKEEIDNKCEEMITGGPISKRVYQIWVVDEDQVTQACKWYDEFRANPSDKRFRGHFHAARKIHDEAAREARKFVEQDQKVQGKRFRFPGRAPAGKITILIIVLAALCFIGGKLMILTEDMPEESQTLIIVSPVYQVLMYDYPMTLKLYYRLSKEYSPKELEDPETLPPEGQALLKEALQTPYWRGLYSGMVKAFEGQPTGLDAPMFEKIREGEVWRLLTPAILHADIFHIFFNVIWMLVLGNQLEQRLGRWRYVFLILIAALVSNLAQYLISGPLFFGLSGIVCAFLGFIWMRQRKAPWEGYHLQKSTVVFITIFVLGMFALQVVSFFFEIAGKESFAPPIANTAHIVGALTGIVMARLPFFAIQERSKS